MVNREHDGDSAAALFYWAHFEKHVLKKKQGTVVDAGQAGAEPAAVAECTVLASDRGFLVLPLDAKGRVRQHVVKRLPLAVVSVVVGILGEGVP